MSVSRRAVVALVVSCCLPAAARAQLIQVKTLPIAQGNQFQVFPSANLGMGSVSVALADSLFDPFANPAMGSRIAASRIFATPTTYSVTQGAGGGRSLPLALLMRHANWYGGLALAVQQVDPARPPQSGGDVVALTPPPSGDVGPFGPGTIPVQSENVAHGNQFAFGMFGRSWPKQQLSLGASVLWNGLHAVDGAELLYGNSRRLEQSGHALDLRLGALKEWPREGSGTSRSLEATLLHHRFATDHAVTFVDAFWNPSTQEFDEQDRLEDHDERTNTWGVELNYQMPLAAPGWRIGWIVTANRVSHAKVPAYELVNVPAIPQEPGYTHAFNLGVGASKVDGSLRYGWDLIYEPISSYTWADAPAPTPSAAGDTIAAGAKTVENRFRFSNIWFRFGVEEALGRDKPTKFQLGLILHPISYRLEQRDHVTLSASETSASWVEWTPTWGLSYRGEKIELRYQGRATKGAGRPGSQLVFFGGPVLGNPGGIVAPPNGAPFMTDVSTVTHQFSLSLPLR